MNMKRFVACIISALCLSVLCLTLADEEDQATFDLAGQTTLTGTWKPTGEDTCAITFEGYEEIPATLSEGALTFEESGQTMTCTKRE